VIAVEAEPHNVLVARANVALNAADNVEVLHAAVTSVPGHVRFAEGLNGRLMEGGRVALSTCPR
jgi:FkbM family methyltransferase